MAANNFIQKAKLINYQGVSCLRNKYYHNTCSLCIDVCPENAFEVVRNKLTLSEQKCINCAACIGSCPSEAISIESFDPNSFVINLKEERESKLSCKNNTPCLAVFDEYHLISMVLRSENSIVCDLAHCKECNLNRDAKVQERILKNIQTSNDFLKSTALEYEIKTDYDKEINDRRAIFRVAIEKVKESIKESDDQSITKLHQESIDSKVPLKYIILKNSIKNLFDRVENKIISRDIPLFFEKQIDFDKCTNCGDCIQFCPSEALKYTSDKQGINFIHAHCIGCDICDHICKTDAISSKESYDLVNIVYERINNLVHYEMVVCQECKCPFPYKSGEPICSRCSSFSSNFENMFTLAKDM